MNRRPLYAGAIFLVLVTVAFFVSRYYGHREAILQGQIIEAKAARLAKEREATLAQQRATEAQKRADSVRAVEEKRREPLIADNARLAAENARLIQAQTERERADRQRVETIPTLNDTQLAAKTVEVLESAYPVANNISAENRAENIPKVIPKPPVFEFNRPAIELTLRAGWETVASRASILGYRDQVSNLETMVNNCNSVAGSYQTELTAERKLTGTLKTESAAWQQSYAGALHEIDLRIQQDKARSRKGFWSRFVPKIGPGACVTMGQDGRVGYGPCVAAIYPIN